MEEENTTIVKSEDKLKSLRKAYKEKLGNRMSMGVEMGMKKIRFRMKSFFE